MFPRIAQESNLSRRPAAQQAIRISNDLYDNLEMPLFEMARGSTRTIGNKPNSTPTNIYDAQIELAAMQKLAMI